MDAVRRAIDDLLSSDEDRAEAAVSALAPMASEARAALQPLLASPDAETRWWAIRAIAALPDDGAAGLLCSALEDPSIGVRQAAALGLRNHPAPEAIPVLTGLLGDADPMLCRLAADALAAIGEPAVPHLERALASPAPSAMYAARALALMKATAAIPALFGALDHESSIARYWAERGLDDLGVGMVFFRP